MLKPIILYLTTSRFPIARFWHKWNVFHNLYRHRNHLTDILSLFLSILLLHYSVHFLPTMTYSKVLLCHRFPIVRFWKKRNDIHNLYRHPNMLLIFLHSFFHYLLHYAVHFLPTVTASKAVLWIRCGFFNCIFFLLKYHIASNCCGRWPNSNTSVVSNFLTTSVCTGRLTVTIVETEAFSRPESLKMITLKRKVLVLKQNGFWI